MSSKNQTRRQRKKQKKAEGPSSPPSQEIAKNEEASNKSNILMFARKYEWMNDNDPMQSMYSRVAARFKRPRNEGEEGEADVTQRNESIDEDKPEVHLGPSRKQLRNDLKPALSELKNATSRPELVEWFDADAAEPFYLVRMKTLPHVVQVPANWQQRSEMPQFAVKPQYELPQNIIDTGIQGARNGDKLDVDYDKMHAAFFSKQPDVTLLPYGQVVDLKLRRAYKPSSKASQKATKPPPVSSKLRKALGLKDNEALPWEETVGRLGPSPGYAHLHSESSGDGDLWGNIV